jgi:ribosomal protein L23
MEAMRNQLSISEQEIMMQQYVMKIDEVNKTKIQIQQEGKSIQSVEVNKVESLANKSKQVKEFINGVKR